MSALNYLWQQKWSAAAGACIVPKGVQKVPDWYRKQLRTTTIYLNSTVKRISEVQNKTLMV